MDQKTNGEDYTKAWDPFECPNCKEQLKYWWTIVCDNCGYDIQKEAIDHEFLQEQDKIQRKSKEQKAWRLLWERLRGRR